MSRNLRVDRLMRRVPRRVSSPTGALTAEGVILVRARRRAHRIDDAKRPPRRAIDIQSAHCGELMIAVLAQSNSSSSVIYPSEATESTWNTDIWKSGLRFR